MPDSSIADLAQMPPDELVRWRGEVLDQLATQIGLTGPNARDEVRTRLETIDPSAWVSAGAESASKPDKPRRERPSRRLLWLLAVLVILVAIVAVISLSGDDETNSSAPPPPAPKPPPTSTTTTKPTTSTTTTTTPQGPTATMQPLPGMPDRGSADISVSGSGNDRTVTVQLKGMPAPGGGGVYELWLYNALIGAQPLGTASSGNATITARLPADAGDFKYLDLSRESGPNDRIHSGISVRRTALAPLLSESG